VVSHVDLLGKYSVVGNDLIFAACFRVFVVLQLDVDVREWDLRSSGYVHIELYLDNKWFDLLIDLRLRLQCLTDGEDRHLVPITPFKEGQQLQLAGSLDEGRLQLISLDLQFLVIGVLTESISYFGQFFTVNYELSVP
jgi:hypothetical protein